MKDINSLSTPINKTAALVTQQPKSNDLEDITNEIATLNDSLQRWEDMASMGNKQAEMKVIEIRQKRKELGRKRKIIKSALSENMECYIVKECRKRFDDEEWKIIIHRARQQWSKELGGEL